MATKVNVKFVIGLAAVLLVLFSGIAWVAYEKLTTSGEEYEAKGDALLAAGNYDEAADMYRRAVGHDQTNVVWLTKWRDTILKVIPETQVEYLKFYQTYYFGILNRLAVLQPLDVTAQRAYLDPYYRQLETGGATAEHWQRLIEHCNSVIDRLPADAPETQALRRYRGLARLRHMAQVEARDAERELALQDLQAALEADPTDVQVAGGIVEWRFMEWRRAHRMRRSQTSDQLWQRLGETLIAKKAQFPNSPRLLLMELQIAIERVLQLEEDPARRVRMMRNLHGAEAPLLEAMAAADPATIDANHLLLMSAALKPVRPSDFAQVILDIATPAVAAQPNNAALKLVRGRALIDQGRYEEALAQLEEVVKMPNQPVSLDGLALITRHRATALFEQADAALNLFRTAQSPERRAQLLAQVKSYRQQLVERVTGGENSNIVMLVDGRLALAENRPNEAIERLKALDDQVGGRDAQVIQLLGEALLESGVLGAAKEQFARLVDMNAGDVRSLFMLAEIERRLRNLEGAAERLEQILAIAPDFDEARLQLRAINAERGIIENIDPTNADPIRVALIRWQALMKQEPPEYEEAIAILHEAHREHGDHPSLLHAFIIQYSQEGDAQQAMAIATQAAAMYPDDKRFTDWVMRLEMQANNLSLEERLARIDAMDFPEVERLIAKSALLQHADQEAEANAMMERAAALAPEHPAIVEHRFSKALTEEDFATARSIASVAARLNLDSVDGLLYQARIEFTQGENQKALGTLQQAIGRIPYDPLALRLLGQTYLRLGRTGDAIDALGQAFQYKPDGLLVARLYVQTLAQLQRHEEALRVVRRAREFNGADRVLTDQWLNLEELVGDRELALAERQKRAATGGQDIQNSAALVRMKMLDHDWSGAKAIIDNARAQHPTVPVLAQLEAEWHARQGDIEAGANILRALETNEDMVDLLVARFYMQFEQHEKAEETLQAALRNQSPGEYAAQLMLADLHFTTRNYADALPLYKHALDAGADNDAGDVARRYAESLLHLERYGDAISSLQRLSGSARQHPRTNILLAKAVAAQGDRRSAQSFLDAAVASSPNDPEPFFERAAFNATDPAQLQDVLEDLNQAIRLAPSSGAARRLKAHVLADNGRQAEAVRELQAAIESNPDDRELRRVLIDLYNRMRQVDPAILLAVQSAERFAHEPGWRITAGDLHAIAGRWNDAVRQYEAAHAIDPNIQISIRLAQAYLEADPPRLNDVLRVLDADNPANASHLSTIYLLESQAHLRQNNLAEARRLNALSYEAARTEADIRDWYNSVASLYPDRSALLDYLRSLQPQEELRALNAVLASRIYAQDRVHHDSVIAELQDVAEATTDVSTLADLYRLLGQLLYFRGDYAEASAVYQKAVAIAPNDLEFNNNLAYLLARYLDDAAGALAPAEKAAQLSPSASDVLDTLGWVYFKLGRLGQAQATLSRALENAREPAQQVPAYLHLAETLLAQSEVTRARRYFDAARELIERSEALKVQFGEQYDAVMRKMNPTE